MKLLFGLEFDEHTLPTSGSAEKDIHRCGRKSLLKTLETHLGLAGNYDGYEYLRVEQYRQLLLQCAELYPNIFYTRSLEADQFATAASLLERRDELLLAGWDFELSKEIPERLQVFAELESMIRKSEQSEFSLSTGYADRFAIVIDRLESRMHPFTEIWVNEPLNFLPVHFQRLLKKIASTWQKPVIRELWGEPRLSGPENDLEVFKRVLQTAGKSEKSKAKADGSLVIIKSKRATDAAIFMAKLFRMNEQFRPACVIPEKNRLLESAMTLEGLPSLGMQTNSYARPTQQLLKLAMAFLWEPVDPYKVLEFVTLPIKPIPDQLANTIAQELARKPGLNGETWKRSIAQFFAKLEEEQPDLVPKTRGNFHFWFERQRFDQSKMAPKSEAIAIYRELHRWALEAFEENGERYPSLQMLSYQSRRIVELLEALPEQWLTPLELERIVRTLYEPTPVMVQARQVGHLPYVNHPASIYGELENIVWWNFTQNESPHFFSKWYSAERAWLSSKGVETDEPNKENDLHQWQQLRPVIACKNRLLLVVPESSNGKELQPHPLLADLHASFENLEGLYFNLDSWTNTSLLVSRFVLPEKVSFSIKPLPSPKAFIELEGKSITSREQESYTSLEALFYHPYVWFFRYKLGLKPSPVHGVIPEYTLKGNLAHCIFEKIMQQDIYSMSRIEVDDWVAEEYEALLKREGVTFLLYGKEPEKVAFRNQLKTAVWSLICAVKEDNWNVHACELPLEGLFPEGDTSLKTAVKGIADLVLEKGEKKAVIDIKLGGSTYRSSVLKNQDDLQLVLYSALLSGGSGYWPQTAYFIIKNAQLIARTNEAFQRADAVLPDSDHADICQSIMEKMKRTWHWRMDQLEHGLIEVRCLETSAEIESRYSETAVNMMELLESKDVERRFDDFKTLIGLIR